MFPRSLSLLVVASLAVSAAAVWANPVFVNIGTTDGNAEAWPTGVSAGGAAVMQGLQSGGYYYRTWIIIPAARPGP